MQTICALWLYAFPILQILAASSLSKCILSMGKMSIAYRLLLPDGSFPRAGLPSSTWCDALKTLKFPYIPNFKSDFESGVAISYDTAWRLLETFLILIARESGYSRRHYYLNESGTRSEKRRSSPRRKNLFKWSSAQVAAHVPQRWTDPSFLKRFTGVV